MLTYGFIDQSVRFFIQAQDRVEDRIFNLGMNFQFIADSQRRFAFFLVVTFDDEFVVKPQRWLSRVLKPTFALPQPS